MWKCENILCKPKIFYLFLFLFLAIQVKAFIENHHNNPSCESNISSLSANQSSVFACREIISLCMENHQNVDIIETWEA
jgi:hypothetical protein